MLTRAELGFAPGDFAVLAVGDLNDNKNHRVLVEAMVWLPESVRLYIAGEGPLREELEGLAGRLGVAGRVTLLGFRGDIPALMNACDLFCMPSRREGLPVSLIEAMATGTPCSRPMRAAAPTCWASWRTGSSSASGTAPHGPSASRRSLGAIRRQRQPNSGRGRLSSG